jgi:hypothetical protein
MSKSKDTIKVRFLDKLFEEKEDPMPVEYILMTDKNKNKATRIQLQWGYILTVIFLIGSLVYLIFFNDYSNTLRSFISLVFAILVIGLIIDYFYMRQSKLLYAKIDTTLKGDRKKDDDIDNNYHLLDI